MPLSSQARWQPASLGDDARPSRNCLCSWWVVHGFQRLHKVVRSLLVLHVGQLQRPRPSVREEGGGTDVRPEKPDVSVRIDSGVHVTIDQSSTRLPHESTRRHPKNLLIYRADFSTMESTENNTPGEHCFHVGKSHVVLHPLHLETEPLFTPSRAK